jgi:hypothetical protein
LANSFTKQKNDISVSIFSVVSPNLFPKILAFLPRHPKTKPLTPKRKNTLHECLYPAEGRSEPSREKISMFSKDFQGPFLWGENEKFPIYHNPYGTSGPRALLSPLQPETGPWKGNPEPLHTYRAI